MKSKCRFCLSESSFFGKDFNNATWFQCAECSLLQQELSSLPSIAEEKKRYQEHNNDPEDENYVAYLNTSTHFLREQLKATWQGLDYGCGPGPAMNKCFPQLSTPIINYDPHFFPEFPKKESFDFITCIEAAEHFYDPAIDWQNFLELLKPKGLLMLRTELFQENIEISNWWYTKDPTHVCIYSLSFFKMLEQQKLWKILACDAKNQILLQKL